MSAAVSSTPFQATLPGGRFMPDGYVSVMSAYSAVSPSAVLSRNRRIKGLAALSSGSVLPSAALAHLDVDNTAGAWLQAHRHLGVTGRRAH